MLTCGKEATMISPEWLNTGFAVMFAYEINRVIFTNKGKSYFPELGLLLYRVAVLGTAYAVVQRYIVPETIAYVARPNRVVLVLSYVGSLSICLVLWPGVLVLGIIYLFKWGMLPKQ
jgi:hypothetical protein